MLTGQKTLRFPYKHANLMLSRDTTRESTGFVAGDVRSWSLMRMLEPQEKVLPEADDSFLSPVTLKASRMASLADVWVRAAS